MQVSKRDGSVVDFDRTKIESAILKAMRYGSGRVDKDVAKQVATTIQDRFKARQRLSIYTIEKEVYLNLINCGHADTARAYEEYRAIQAYKRETKNTIDDSVLGLLNLTNSDVARANSNKNAKMISTQRDLIAGEVSKDITMRYLLPTKIVQAHNDGVLHFHDLDYAMTNGMTNCCLVDIGDMLDNGTEINGVHIDSPHSFRTACNIMTQIVACVASNQYGGQTVDVKHLGKYLRKSAMRYVETYTKLIDESVPNRDELISTLAENATRRELTDGVQLIQYQCNSLSTTNGQSPFITLFLNLEEGDEYELEVAMIIAEILRQRIQGVKNSEGVYVTPTFPKLIYVLDEHNCLKGGKYDCLTELAAECSAKRMYPDYISAKKMREHYDGNIIPAMGCRSFLRVWHDENGKPKFEGRFNAGVVSINLPQIAIIASGKEYLFWELLDSRLELCKEALMYRHDRLLGTKASVSPIHWQHGALTRLNPDDVIDKYLYDGYSTMSLGYIGVYEMTMLMKGVSHTTEEGKKFALKVMKHLKDTCDKWFAETNIGFSLYGVPGETLCYRFAKIDKAKFGVIKDVTDKGYYTNSYHVDVREKIDAFTKLKMEEDFQKLSLGGCISYIEVPSMYKNVEAIKSVIKFIYDNIQYAEFNTKLDYCYDCGLEGEMFINDNGEFECPQCGNTNRDRQYVVRRTCGLTN